MSYRVLHDTPDRLTVLLDGQPAFLLTPDAHGIWEAYDCRSVAIDGDLQVVRSLLPFDRGLKCAVVLARLCRSLMAVGHLAQVPAGFIIPAPREARDFYLSGTGFLCARQPVVRVLTQQPVPTGAGGLMRPATEEECLSAGLLPDEAAVFLRV